MRSLLVIVSLAQLVALSVTQLVISIVLFAQLICFIVSSLVPLMRSGTNKGATRASGETSLNKTQDKHTHSERMRGKLGGFGN